MDEKFLRVVGEVLENEGGYRNDPDDPGGETNFGISRRSYPDLDIQNLSRDEAIGIYYRDWWDRYGYHLIDNEEIAGELLDLAVNMGAQRAHTLVQISVNQTSEERLKIDGVLGSLTRRAINQHPCPAWLLADFKLRVIGYYLSLAGKRKFLAGWVGRALN